MGFLKMTLRSIGFGYPVRSGRFLGRHLMKSFIFSRSNERNLSLKTARALLRVQAVFVICTCFPSPSGCHPSGLPNQISGYARSVQSLYLSRSLGAIDPGSMSLRDVKGSPAKPQLQSGVECICIAADTLHFLVSRKGLEPMVPRLKGGCSTS